MKTSKNEPRAETRRAMPILCGADIELANFVASAEPACGTGYEASRALLAEIEGMPIRKDSHSLNSRWSAAPAVSRTGANTGKGVYFPASGWGYNLQDVARRFLPGNGGCAYIDLDHAELCIPEVLSALDHVASWHAMLRLMRGALDRANEGRPQDRRIKVLVNNSDGHGHSWGSHLNFLISRGTWDNILLTGQGKVGSENGRPRTPYQLSQRSDHMETLMGVQTTFRRPLVNARDEALSGRSTGDDPSAPARLHCIFHDSAMAHGSCLFRVGPMQLILALMESGKVNPRLILDDPLEALESFSHDPTLKATAKVITGQHLTVLELQSAFLDEVKRYAAQGMFEGVVPRFEQIIALWEDALNKFAEGDLMALAPRLDWVMKLMAIERAIDDNPSLDWDSPEIKMIDHLYSSLDDDGLYRAYEASGFTEQLIPPERIDYFTENPPEDTRAWTRAMLLRRASSDDVDVDSVDWDRITFKIRGRYSWPSYRAFEMSNPLGFTKAEAQPIFDSCLDFGDLLDGLESLASGTALPAYANAVN